MPKLSVNNIISYFSLILFFITSCKKQNDFLDEKPTQSLSTISTIDDVQELLRNEVLFNKNSAPVLGEATTDDYYVTSDDWLGNLAAYEQNEYIFSKNIFSADESDYSWNNAYAQVLQANTALDALPKVGGSQQQVDNAKGAALFYRSYAFYNLVQNYSLPYDSLTASTNLGIPLRLNSDLNAPSIRATEKECYDQILNNIKTAVPLLPPTTQYTTQPNKIGAFALLARIYLALGNYSEALKYSDSTLSLKSTLVNFNDLILSSFYFTDISQYPLSEDIFHSTFAIATELAFTVGVVDSTLYSLYEDDDLRKVSFFSFYGDHIRFKGSYEFKFFGMLYDGLATDEMYLIRAECKAREGDIVGAMDDLNILLGNRYKKGKFSAHSATSSDEAINQILLERRKELCFRGRRWEDLRRLNKDPKYALTLVRILQGTTYTLPPNDPRYAMPIPSSEIKLSNLQQNKR